MLSKYYTFAMLFHLIIILKIIIKLFSNTRGVELYVLKMVVSFRVIFMYIISTCRIVDTIEAN
jgi:hypothetical protein